MRTDLAIRVAICALLPACGSDAVEGAGTDGGTDTDTDTDGSAGTDSGTSTTNTTNTTNSTTDPTAATDSATGGGDCMPGENVGCTCDMGVPGTQTCDGSGAWGPCECGGGSDTSTTGVTTDPTTGGTTDPSTGGTTDPTTGGGAACTGTEEITLDAGDATLSGGWELSMSQVGEGEIATIPQGNGTDGSVLWSVDIPCEDTWHVWVRYWEEGQNDSYYVTVDGQPQPAAIFEGACDQGGQGYGWTELNWRDENDGPCQYVEDPWTFDWAGGSHDIELSFRESWVVARIVVTNDANYQP